MKYFIAGLAFAVLMAVIVTAATAQETDYMRCVNGKGQVVIVTNWTCPAGYWPS